MKLKIKFLLLIVLTVLISVSTSMYVLTKNHIEKTSDNFYEDHTYSALNMSYQLEEYLKKLSAIDVTQKDKIIKFYPEINYILLIDDGKISQLFKKKSDLDAKVYSKILEKSFRSLFKIDTMLAISLFQDDKNFVYLVDTNFISNFAGRSQGSGIGIFNTIDYKVINLGASDFSFVRPDKDVVDNMSTNQGVFTKLQEGKNRSTLVALSPINDDKQSFVMVQADQKEINQVIVDGVSELVLLIFLLVICFVIISILLIHNFLRPIDYLIEATKDIGKGNWEIKLKTQNKDEVGLLTRSFNSMAFELKQREEKIINVQKKLAQSEKLASLGMFSAGVAHEVKNPLGAILGNAQLIKRKLTDEKLISYGQTIIEETYRANDIVQDLLVFAKERELKVENIKSLDFIKKLHSIFDPIVSEKGINLKTSTELDKFCADKDQLLQVIENLILNAIDAFDGLSQEEKEISFNIGSEDEKCQITIRDNASGMSEEVKDKIFEPFFSTKKSKKGTGLGMAISYGIIQKHDGKITVNSTLGEGTTFIIEL